jgi:hypothetical protein
MYIQITGLIDELVRLLDKRLIKIYIPATNDRKIKCKK